MINKHTLAALALAACAGLANAQATPASAAAPTAAKKDLIAKLIAIQTGNAEGLAKTLVAAPLGPMGQEVRIAMQQVPVEKREAVGKAIDAEVKKFGDESVPLVKERIVKVAPEVIGKSLDEKFNEDELRQLVAWLESPLAKKFDAVSPEMGRALQERLLADMGPTLNTKLSTLRNNIVKHLGLTPPPQSAAPATANKPAAKK
ncbi:DUF2059 domain-containing protein [Pelomonas sp. V22]|uniref:DUF2059 domain-containing protein n=1 Tax=Pelomonas sp. V22 TaxID=2822139 RepID=UPI0024A91910|nr:DUF2059 domain-containing protein [Pelomonas sp. V22]MDI4631836.1 DUF2059 domain-containing protein [Pelomonas sp. V22]